MEAVESSRLSTAVSPTQLASGTQPLCHRAGVYHNIHNTRLTLIATLLLQGESPTFIHKEDTQPVIRAIGVLHTACEDEFRQNIRSHSYVDCPYQVHFFNIPPRTGSTWYVPGTGTLQALT